MKSGTTIIHPMALAATLIAGILVLFLPRKYTYIPLIVVAIFIPMQQRIVVLGLDFYMLRILILFGWIRVFVRSEQKLLKFNALDKLIVFFAFINLLTYTILWQTWGALINRLGIVFNIIGIYFLMRFLIHELDDITRIIKTFSLVCLLLCPVMIIEHETGRNFFSIFGGVPKFTALRGGMLRCQGAFAHPIMAGTFAATLAPIFFSFWRNVDKSKNYMFLGAISATVITILSFSSGPILSYIAGMGALLLWSFRRYMRQIIYASVIMIISLHIYMKAPVWALIARAKVIGPSTAWHRYHLIDQFIKHFDEWWLFGVKSNAHWGHITFDITNWYLRIAADGGLITLCLFLSILFYSFKIIGRVVSITENLTNTQKIYWSIGASLFAHSISFVGISYFDQIILLWYLTLAIIAHVKMFMDAETIELAQEQIRIR